MSLIPTLSREIFPQPRIRMGEVPVNATAMKPHTTLPRLSRDSSERFRSNPRTAQSRGRAISDAEYVPAQSRVRGRGTTFGSTQEFQETHGSATTQRLDRETSSSKVQGLLKLRRQKLKEAKRKGDDIEILRLKNLNLFDTIEMPNNSENRPNELGFNEDISGENNRQSLTSQVDVVGVGFTCQPSSVNQGHTATLCWHLKLEFAHGKTVPDEFSRCTIHPTPSPCASSSPSLALQPSSPSSSRSGSRRSLRRTKLSSISSSTLGNCSDPCSPATSSSTAIASEPSSPLKHSTDISSPEDEDPFLYIAKYVMRNAEDDSQVNDAEVSRPQASNAGAKRPSHTKCTCTNHNCLIYLSGPPSKHCRFCKLPRRQTEITAAVNRIEDMKASVVVMADANLPGSSEAELYGKFEALQEDMRLVEMYNAETEKRCRNGVWWEGWLIVEDLKRQGIIGSKPYIYARENSVA